MDFFVGMELSLLDSTTDRVVLPVKFRKSLMPEANKKFTLIKGADENIFAFPYNKWLKLLEKLKKLNAYDPKHRFTLDFISMFAEEVTLDSQNRFIIPKVLKEIANINDKVLFVGMGHFLALWNPDLHQKYVITHSEDKEYRKAPQEILYNAIQDLNDTF